MQLSDAASTKAEAGIQRAADRAERLDQGWIAMAAEDLRRFFAERREERATIDKARRHCRPVPDGADGRAWGCVTRRAERLGYIERVPGMYAPADSSNGSPKPVYKAGRHISGH